MKIDVVNLSNEKIEELDLDSRIFEAEIRSDLMARVVKWQLAKARSGNHKSKTRSEVKHTTRKPFKQKGTGRARQGMTSVPHMRGGGVAFGPVVRDHSHKLPKKVRVLGLKSAISSKFKEGNVLVLENINIEDGKTKNLSQCLIKLGLSSTLFVGSSNINDNFKKAVANLVNVDVLPHIGLNVYDILRHNKLVFTKDGARELMERLNAKK